MAEEKDQGVSIDRMVTWQERLGYWRGAAICHAFPFRPERKRYSPWLMDCGGVGLADGVSALVAHLAPVLLAALFRATLHHITR